MSVSIRSVTAQGFGSPTLNMSVTTPSASVGDVLLIIASNDYYLLSDIALNSISPTATATEITGFDCDGGTNQPHIKAWWAPVVTAGAATVSATSGHNDEEKALAVYVISGADTSNPVDASANSGAVTSAQNPVAPSVTTTKASDLLICHVQTDGSGFSTTYSVPGSMTSQYNVTDGTFMRAVGGTEALSATGSTGTRTFTGNRTNGWVASSVAIKAAAAAPAFVQGNQTGDSTNNTVTTCAFSSNVTAGNLLVVAAGFASTSDTAAITDTLGNTYQTAVGPTDNVSIGYRTYIFYTVCNASGANTVTMTTSSNWTFRRLLVHEYSAVNALDATHAATGASGTIDSGSATTRFANELIFGWGVSNNGTTSAGTGFTLRETALVESTEDQMVSSTGSYNATYPADGSAWLCQVATFYFYQATAVTSWWRA